MCLDRVTATYDKPSSLIVDARKKFGGSGGALRFQNFGGQVEMDKWLKASEIQPPMELAALDGKKYQAGFHAYADELEVKSKFYLRVYLRGITCTGYQDEKRAVIAREMYVPSDPDAWPPQEKTQPPATPAQKPSRFKRLRGKRS